MKELRKDTVIYVDCDGVILDGSHDDLFVSKLQSEEFNTVLDWYNRTYVADLALNIELLTELQNLKSQGFKVVLWTNRGPAQYEMTKENLGVYWDVFDDHIFLDGGKRKVKSLRGYVLEDSRSNCMLATEGFRYVNFRQAA